MTTDRTPRSLQTSERWCEGCGDTVLVDAGSQAPAWCDGCRDQLADSQDSVTADHRRHLASEGRQP